MADTEEYFPRGGKKPVVQHFKQSSNFLGAPEKSEKKRKRPKKKSEADDGYLSDEATKEVDQSYKNCAVGLSYKSVKQGVLILGRVRQVQETKVNIMLPCKMLGSVMACHISEAYNKILEAYVNDETEKVLELPSMFHPGQYVAVKVLEVDGDHLMLSMMPHHVNDNKTQADLHNGCLLQAAVSSVEDHGYVMDIGIPNTRAFLPKKDSNPELELDTGMLTWCTVKAVTPSSDNCIVKLSSHLDAIQAGVLKKKPKTALLPGTAVDFVVDQPLENGIEGHIFGDTVAYVQRQHADKVKDKKPALGQKVRARVLYVMPTRNTPFLTLRNIFETTRPDLGKEQKYKEGDIIEDAQVIKITGRSIHFKLGKRSVGTMSLRRIQVDEDLSDEQVVAKSYPVGSTHKVRVLTYNMSDYLYSISDQPSLLNEKYFSIDQLSVGEVVTGTVKTVTDSAVTVTVGRMTGYVPHAHLFDAGVFIDRKKASTSKLPKKKYKVGQEVKARVLHIDVPKQNLILTLKPTLLSPDLEVLSSYEQAEIGKAYTGVIKHIRDYVLVSFFNNVTAFVARTYVTKDPDVVLAEAFHVGQIVSCTVLKVDVEARKMAGSLTTTPFWPAKKREPQKRKQQSQHSDNIPNKKQRTDSESSEHSDFKKKKNDKKKLAQETDIVTEVEDKRAKKKEKRLSESEVEVESKKKKDKNKEKKVSVSEPEEECDEIDDETKNKKDKKSKKTTIATEAENNKATKKKKNKTPDMSDEESGIDNTDHVEIEDVKSRKRKKDRNVVSEESDAIETDIYDDSDQMLTPQELGLIDLSDCSTPKQYKKRVVSLLKCIKAKTTRLQKIENKIEALEERGLDAYTKKFHTAMQADKLVTQERIKKLMEALEKAQERLKEFNTEDSKEYKKKKEIKKERKISEQESNTEQKEDKVKKEKKMKDIKVVESLEPALQVPSAKDFWSSNPDDFLKDVHVEESSSSDDEEKEQPKKKRKKLTVAEKVAKVREEEERVREMERRAIESESQPRSSEQFERALLAHPDSSQLWIAYMAFHLQSTEIEKARAVGRKALSTINFREEQERLNVWLAMLNTEHRFGTKESQQKLLEEALQMNDTYKIHSKLLDILVETSKHQELSSLVDHMMRKYKRDPQSYILCGTACFKLSLVDKARQVMQKAIAVLEKKEHVSVLVQFALLERSHGAPERAEALFEQVLAVYPQRVDVCSVYADMLVKSSDAERVRQVMERMTSQKLPAKKMKVLYKKWIEVEEKLGDPDEVEKIRQRAMEFIENAKF